MKTKQFRYSKDNFQISKAPTFVKDSSKNLKKIKKHIKKNVKHLKKAQAKLYARHEYSILIVLQGMDAAGKDSMIRHVLSGINPSGFNVASFKQPTAEELDHDYLWRVTRKLPPRGHIGVFNRSYYEDVLVSRVHPQIILNDNLPEVHSLADVNDKFFEKRYKDIRHYEEHLAKNGYIILKFFLHLSKDEQKKRFLARIDTPRKNWKLSSSDIKERQYWNKYQDVYQKAINATSTKKNPWYVIPADDKWYSRLIVSDIITKRIEQLPLAYPAMTPAQEKELEVAKQLLDDEAKY
ncbi:PPK2 family polyphosphate kinase [Lactobacillus crispatus]|jgi:PPK2 family polyphosphate:nucleotide phosphotransferase|uniref:PPK2 family polyphosphate kinase n=1 Tax=Lactobacillus crispatus TaxID=47770 RepID=UPI0018A9C21D|nr:PPK2 family polyphosphate kinase [Lactobacillus crispatus]MCH4004848.1 polyphosphate kinase 2 family protein [Lactobacillus crispatus]MCI1336554.1 polyphosphate kinase 2 family protein [Lactobacillus crispatus]MCI1366084.1 polyphosphate kinase 2 family protein [Lactobacillus crispatus]MCI1494404.1 polyphosphate kinase 2 family protein [Lactobacillus crispatus]